MRTQGQHAELHLHFEGSLDVAVLNRIGRRLGLRDLAPDALRIAGWDDGERAFEAVLARLRDRAAFTEAMWAVLARLSAEGIAYAEISLMPAVHAALGVDVGVAWAGIAEALEASGAPGPTVRFLFAVPRNGGAAAGFETLRMVEEAAHPAVIGIDLAGTEADDTIACFAPVFAAAREMGLHTAAHAGEFGPASRVSDTLRLLRPGRIGHGLAAAADAGVLRELVASGVPVDLSPTGNVAFGAVPDLAAHPLRRMFDAGVPITVSTDDPALVGVTLAEEYGLLSSVFRLSAAEVHEVAQNGFRYAFAAPDMVAPRVTA